MELSLRKARKLEAKIATFIDSMSLEPNVRVRVMLDDEQRNEALSEARKKYKNDLNIQKSLISARFYIRRLIANANHEVGINDLINEREEIQALLSKSNSGVDSLNLLEASDLAKTKRLQLEKAEHRLGDVSVTFPLPVSTEEDVQTYKLTESNFKKSLENIEDLLSQKNLGVKIRLNEDVVILLKSAGLI